MDLTPTPISSRLLLESQKATREDLEKYFQPQSNKGDDAVITASKLAFSSAS